MLMTSLGRQTRTVASRNRQERSTSSARSSRFRRLRQDRVVRPSRSAGHLEFLQVAGRILRGRPGRTGRSAYAVRQSWVVSCSLALWAAACFVLLCGPAYGGDDSVTPDYFSGGGIMFRAAHIEGQGIPQIQSITPVELFPYYFAEESLFFGDLRFFPTNSLTVGGNAGLGYRYYSEGLDRVFGASGWYDGDNSR